MKALNFSAIVMTMTLVAGTGAHATQFTIKCVNVASGTSWSLKVDDRQQTVDGAPARVTAAAIAWRNNGGFFDLDRSSGVLTFTNASSTGGYILRHQCRLD
jgi:hypothetical protein